MKEKNKSVVGLGEELKIKKGDVKEEKRVLYLNRTAKSQYEKIFFGIK